VVNVEHNIQKSGGRINGNSGGGRSSVGRNGIEREDRLEPNRNRADKIQVTLKAKSKKKSASSNSNNSSNKSIDEKNNRSNENELEREREPLAEDYYDDDYEGAENKVSEVVAEANSTDQDAVTNLPISEDTSKLNLTTTKATVIADEHNGSEYEEDEEGASSVRHRHRVQPPPPRYVPTLDEALAKLEADNDNRLMMAAENFFAHERQGHQVKVTSTALTASLINPELNAPSAEEVRLVQDEYEVMFDDAWSGCVTRA